MVATLKIPWNGVINEQADEKTRIWEVTDRTVRTWIGQAVAAAAADGVTLSGSAINCHHPYAMHMLSVRYTAEGPASLMGHKSISSTEVYTKVFALDVAARHRVQI